MTNNSHKDETTEIITKEKGSLIEPIQINTFERVDFLNAATLTRYGEDVLSTTVEAANAFIENYAIEDMLDPEFYKKVDRLSGLPVKVQKLSGKRNKPSNGLIKFAQEFLKMSDNRNEKLSFSRLANEQNTNIDEMVEVETRMMEVNNAHFATNYAYIKAIKPFLPILDEVIALGEYDRDIFEKEVLLAESESRINPKDQDLEREARLGRLLIGVFNDRIMQLHKQRYALSQNIGAKDIQQEQLMQLQLSHNEFIRSDSYLLKMVGLSQISDALIKEDTDRQFYLSSRINEILTENSVRQVQTTKDIVKLRSGGGNIKVDTLKKMVAGIVQCGDIIQKGAEIDRKYALQQAKELPVLVAQLEAKMENLRESSLTVLMEDIGESSKFKVLGKQRTPVIGSGSEN